MSDVLRIECPECGTSFRTDTLKVKTNPGDKVIVQCYCHNDVEAEFFETPATPTTGWRSWFQRAQGPVKGVKVNATPRS